MLITPLTGKLITMSVLFIAWTACYERAKRLNPDQPFHVAADRRDRRKARFYFLSVWIGLAAAFLSFLCLDALSDVPFDSALQREWVFGVARSIGIWGLAITTVVWTQVGQRAGEANSDGKSLVPASEKYNQPRG